MIRNSILSSRLLSTNSRSRVFRLAELHAEEDSVDGHVAILRELIDKITIKKERGEQAVVQRRRRKRVRDRRKLRRIDIAGRDDRRSYKFSHDQMMTWSDNSDEESLPTTPAPAAAAALVGVQEEIPPVPISEPTARTLPETVPETVLAPTPTQTPTPPRTPEPKGPTASERLLRELNGLGFEFNGACTLLFEPSGPGPPNVQMPVSDEEMAKNERRRRYEEGMSKPRDVETYKFSAVTADDNAQIVITDNQFRNYTVTREDFLEAVKRAEEAKLAMIEWQAQQKAEAERLAILKARKVAERKRIMAKAKRLRMMKKMKDMISAISTWSTFKAKERVRVPLNNAVVTAHAVGEADQMRVLFDGLQHLLHESLEFFEGSPHLPATDQITRLLGQMRKTERPAVVQVECQELPPLQNDLSDATKAGLGAIRAKRSPRWMTEGPSAIEQLMNGGFAALEQLLQPEPSAPMTSLLPSLPPGIRVGNQAPDPYGAAENLLLAPSVQSLDGKFSPKSVESVDPMPVRYAAALEAAAASVEARASKRRAAVTDSAGSGRSPRVRHPRSLNAGSISDRHLVRMAVLGPTSARHRGAAAYADGAAICTTGQDGATIFPPIAHAGTSRGGPAPPVSPRFAIAMPPPSVTNVMDKIGIPQYIGSRHKLNAEKLAAKKLAADESREMERRLLKLAVQSNRSRWFVS